MKQECRRDVGAPCGEVGAGYFAADGLPRRQPRSAFYLLLQHHTGLEGQHEFGRDELALSGVGVDHDALHLFLHLKGAEPLHGKGGFAVERVGHAGYERGGELLRLLGGEGGAGGECADEVFVVHKPKLKNLPLLRRGRTLLHR